MVPMLMMVLVSVPLPIRMPVWPMIVLFSSLMILPLLKPTATRVVASIRPKLSSVASAGPVD